MAVSVTVSVSVSVTVSVSEGRVRGSDRGSEPGARPRHGHLRVVHTDRFEESGEPRRHSQSPPARSTSQPRRHEDTKGFTKPRARPKTQRRRGAEPPTRPKNAKAQRRKDAKRRVPGLGALPHRGGRTAGDRIACRRQEAGELRTRAFVVATLLTGSRARGTAVLPLALPSVSHRDGPVSILLNEGEKWRGLRSPRARATPLSSPGSLLRLCVGAGACGLAPLRFRVGGRPS